MVQLLETPREAAQWLQARVRGTLQTDSRKLVAGDGFIAWPGATHDARSHVPAALTQGVAACLVEQLGVEAFGFDDARIAALPGLKANSARVAGAYHGEPSQALDMLAVTGTNGKTSTVWWLSQALSDRHLQAPRRCAMVGTLGVGFPLAEAHPGDAALGGLTATGLTTPDAVLLQGSLRGFVDAGATACAIEASSIGIQDHRLDGTRIHTAIFTNLTQDHLDYHGTMQAYWQAKQRLFRWPGLRAAVVNIDDAHGAELATSLADAGLDLWTVSRARPARLCASDLCDTPTGMVFSVTEAGQTHRLDTSLIGHYNVSNLLGVLGAMRSLGVPLDEAVAACRALQPVPGRMQCVAQPGQPLVVVDYAHTPDALEQALGALRPLATQRGGVLWCVFGCGGDRDPAKRPLMGAAVARGADRVVLTSDNPRREDPLVILQQIAPGLAGHGHVVQQVDRAQAIAYAVAGAQPGDVVLIAGKGHEAYQEIDGRRLPFSDLDQVYQALATRRAMAQGVAA